MIAKVTYLGGLRTEAVHVQSGTVIQTDAPKDNHGQGEKFSPTDLVASALGSCMLTIMGIYAENHQVDITGASVNVQKIMSAAPRRIAEIVVTFEFPKDKSFTDSQKQALQRAALECPVAKTLHPETKQTVVFNW